MQQLMDPIVPCVLYYETTNHLETQGVPGRGVECDVMMI